MGVEVYPGMNAIEAAHTVAIRELKEQTDRLEQRMAEVATKEDIARIEARMDRTDAKIDQLADKALDYLPPWAARQLQLLGAVVGAVVSAVVAAVVGLFTHKLKGV